MKYIYIHLTLVKTVSAATLLEVMKPQWQLIHVNRWIRPLGLRSLILVHFEVLYPLVN